MLTILNFQTSKIDLKYFLKIFNRFLLKIVKLARIYLSPKIHKKTIIQIIKKKVLTESEFYADSDKTIIFVLGFHHVAAATNSPLLMEALYLKIIYLIDLKLILFYVS